MEDLETYLIHLKGHDLLLDEDDLVLDEEVL